MNYENKIPQVENLNKEIDSLRPLSNDILRQIKEYYKISYTFSSNAIEGNTLSESETKIVIEDGLTVAGKPLRDHNEALGHSEAYNHLWTLKENKKITYNDILDLHKLFFYRISSDEAGKLRNNKVIITGTEYIPPEPIKLEKLLKNAFENLELKRGNIHPIALASKAHMEIVNIHPFIDGNGRCARLFMNLILLQEGYIIGLIPPILRSDYISIVKDVQLAKKDERFFINFISNCLYETTKDYLRLLKSLI
ncbi:MAG: Fic family protein [Pseudomonadota bacterium]